MASRFFVVCVFHQVSGRRVPASTRETGQDRGRPPSTDNDMPSITFKDFPDKNYKCSMRLLRICNDNRIHRLADFTRLTLADVLSLPECGMATAMQIKKMLTDNGLDFGSRFDPKGATVRTLRNDKIVELVSHGGSYREVGRRFGISHARVAQICQTHDFADESSYTRSLGL